MSSSDGLLCVASWNVEYNGRRRGDEDRSGSAHTILAGYGPHIVFRQELTGAADNGRQDLFEEAEHLGGLFPFMADPQPGRSRHVPGVMVDPRLFEVVAHHTYDMQWKPITHVAVRLRGHPRVLHLASAHLTHFSPEIRVTESQKLTTLADHGRTVLAGLDANSYPHRTADETTEPLDWNTVEDRVHYRNRTVVQGGRRVSDTQPSEILTGGERPVFTDLAHHAGTVLGQPDAMAATANLIRTDQGPPQRIDIGICTPDLTPALRRFETVATQQVRDVTNHALLLAWYDLDHLGHILTTD